MNTVTDRYNVRWLRSVFDLVDSLLHANISWPFIHIRNKSGITVSNSDVLTRLKLTFTEITVQYTQYQYPPSSLIFGPLHIENINADLYMPEQTLVNSTSAGSDLRS